jgi:hypothetical protein
MFQARLLRLGNRDEELSLICLLLCSVLMAGGLDVGAAPAATRLEVPRTTLNPMMRKLGISRKDLR